MQRADFTFALPDSLIARYPAVKRQGSRLLCVQGNNIAHRQFSDFATLLKVGDVLVLNNTKVMHARLFGYKATGGAVELLIERVLSSHQALVHCRASKRPKVGSLIYINDQISFVVESTAEDLLKISLQGYASFETLLKDYGQIPLPLYFRREAEPEDYQRYQTVYAQTQGSVAAPTAGLHFDQAMLDQLTAKGVNIQYITLHIGAGTFQSLRSDDQTELHAELAELTPQVCEQITQAKQQNRRIIAVGTTTVRTLETAALSGKLQPFVGETRLFIKPGFQFKCIDALLTNFHLPESSLLMLVCAFGGYHTVMNAYQIAVSQQYRFYSYGDAMWLES